jgi:hypothetical protein
LMDDFKSITSSPIPASRLTSSIVSAMDQNEWVQGRRIWIKDGEEGCIAGTLIDNSVELVSLHDQDMVDVRLEDGTVNIICKSMRLTYRRRCQLNDQSLIQWTHRNLIVVTTWQIWAT